VHCASGFRASIAGSFLERADKDVVVIADDVAEATTSGLLTT
jgi:rhodanese-related sulfurtransferase